MQITSQSKIQEWRGKVATQHTEHRTNYPAAPSAGPNILRIYEELLVKAIKNKPNFKALVLGSTPETRELVNKYNGHLCSIDISIEMMLKTKELVKIESEKLEHLLRSDWLDNPLAENYFDVVLGDGVANNVSLDNQKLFISQLHRVLKPGGHLIIRECCINPDRPIQGIEQISADFDAGKIHWFDAFISSYLYSDISAKCSEKDLQQKRLLKYFDLLEQAFIEGRVSKKMIDALWWFKKDLNHTMLPKFEFIALLQEFFQLFAVEQANDYQFTSDSFLFFFGQARK